METIWKFHVPLADSFTIEMPQLSEILCIQMQNDFPNLWALVFDDSRLIPRTFLTIGTGHKMPITKERKKYIGTYQLDNGKFIYHVFELIK